MENSEKIPLVGQILSFLGATGISQRRLAREAGIGQPIISRILGGSQRDVTTSTADALLRAMQSISDRMASGEWEPSKGGARSKAKAKEKAPRMEPQGLAN